jgi:L-amino acid N-acyltransferase YncA
MMKARLDDEPYVAWAIAGAPPIAVATLGESAVADSVAEALRDTIRERIDASWAERYAHAYLLREVALERDARVLAGIHFYGGDVTKPFVGVLAQTRELTTDERIEATASSCDAFAVFAPAAAWWWVAGLDDGARRDGRLVPDQRVLTGSIPALVRHDGPGALVPFELRRDESGVSHDAYVRLFDAFVAAHPLWHARLTCSGLEDFEECARSGGLFVAEYQGQIAGVFAARPGEVNGIPGWLVEEEFLGDALRGRGLASTLQAMALARLDASARPLVMGTIHALNEPSLRTARRVGRSDVGGWVFVRDTRQSARWLQ